MTTIDLDAIEARAKNAAGASPPEMMPVPMNCAEVLELVAMARGKCVSDDDGVCLGAGGVCNHHLRRTSDRLRGRIAEERILCAQLAVALRGMVSRERGMPSRVVDLEVGKAWLKAGETASEALAAYDFARGPMA